MEKFRLVPRHVVSVEVRCKVDREIYGAVWPAASAVPPAAAASVAAAAAASHSEMCAAIAAQAAPYVDQPVMCQGAVLERLPPFSLA